MGANANIDNNDLVWFILLAEGRSHVRPRRRRKNMYTFYLNSEMEALSFEVGSRKEAIIDIIAPATIAKIEERMILEHHLLKVQTTLAIVAGDVKRPDMSFGPTSISVTIPFSILVGLLPKETWFLSQWAD
jgi:hypothetical protein